jgi:hypothetical protein
MYAVKMLFIVKWLDQCSGGAIMKKLISLLIGFVSLASTINTSSATIINVPSSQPTIQAGINAASPGDTVLVQPGRYVENIDFKGKDIVVGSMFIATRDTSYIAQTIIDGDKNGSVVTFNNGETDKAELCGFKVWRGDTLYDTTQPGLIVLSWGGGIYCYNASPYLHHLIVDDNVTDYDGGGIHLEKSNSVIEYCVIRNNRAVITGNGLNLIQSNNQIKNCLLNDNSGYRSGIHCTQSKVLFFQVLLFRNLTSFALETSSSVINIINCTITDNYSDTFAIFQSDINIINSIFWNNSPQLIIDDPGEEISEVNVAFSDFKNGKNSIKITSSKSVLSWKEGNIDNDPLFLNNGSYSLSSSSPCIDMGTPFYQVNDSIIVNLDKSEYFGKAPDIGALESDITQTGIFAKNTKKIELKVFPNPFNTTISLEFEIQKISKVNLSIFSITGQKIKDLVSDYLSVGRHIYRWDGVDMSGKKVASGIYIVRLKDEVFSQIKCVLFLK